MKDPRNQVTDEARLVNGDGGRRDRNGASAARPTRFNSVTAAGLWPVPADAVRTA